MKHWSMNEWSERMKPTSSWVETPADFLERIRPSYEGLLSDLRRIKVREEAMERIEMYLMVQLNPQLRGHAESFWRRLGVEPSV